MVVDSEECDELLELSPGCVWNVELDEFVVCIINVVVVEFIELME
jgi:hypothetical protein